MLVEATLVGLVEVAAVEVDPGRVLDLVLAVGDRDVVPVDRAPSTGTNDSLVPNRPVLTVRNSGLTGLVVEEHLADLADLVPLPE